ncbi:MAG: winged helix-turn-helix transcriptional regulator [Planctomycetota bacterium]
MSEDLHQKVLDYLLGLQGKGVQTTVEIAKNTGLSRKDCSKILRELEEQGKVASAGVMAGVAGYKAVKK